MKRKKFNLPSVLVGVIILLISLGTTFIYNTFFFEQFNWSPEFVFYATFLGIYFTQIALKQGMFSVIVISVLAALITGLFIPGIIVGGIFLVGIGAETYLNKDLFPFITTVNDIFAIWQYSFIAGLILLRGWFVYVIEKGTENTYSFSRDNTNDSTTNQNDDTEYESTFRSNFDNDDREKPGWYGSASVKMQNDWDQGKYSSSYDFNRDYEETNGQGRDNL